MKVDRTCMHIANRAVVLRGGADQVLSGQLRSSCDSMGGRGEVGTPRGKAATMRLTVLAATVLGVFGLQTAGLAQIGQPRSSVCMRQGSQPRAVLATSSTAGSQNELRSSSAKTVQTEKNGASHNPANGRAAPPFSSPKETALTRSLQQVMGSSQTSEVAARKAKMLEESYEACRVITEQYAKTFYFGTKFFSEEKRRAVWAVYAWCRRLDDIVDKPRKNTGSLRDELAEWKLRLHDIFDHGRAWDMLDLALVDTVKRYPALSVEPFEDMIKGMVMDLDQNRFETFEELYVYCYRVAGTVGLMTMPIMGVAPGATFEEALEPALALGVALQLTNILRDVGEDRVRQRIYLPQEDLRRFNVTEAALLKGVHDERYVALLKFQIARAREWYGRAEDGIALLAEDARLPVRASLDMYSTILNKIEQNEYDNFNKRAYTAKWEKLMILPRSWLRVQNPDLKV